jgi:hypothetical protein
VKKSLLRKDLVKRADFKMQENVAMAMSSVGVQTLVCLSIQQVTQAKVYLPLAAP